MGKLIPAAIGALSIGCGAVVMLLMLGSKQGPAEATATDEEQTIRVEVYRAMRETVPVTISGYGEARALRDVPIAPEVSGRVAWVAPELIVGGVVVKDDVLLRIDSATYDTRMKEAEARVRQYTSSVRALELEFKNEQARLEAISRATELAGRQLSRAKQMVKEGIGSTSDVEAAEREVVTAKNEQDLVARSVEVYPVRIEEAKSLLESAEEQLKLAQQDVDRTVIRAPFDGRITMADVEANQVITSGVPIMVLADDSELEISVPLDSRVARESLRFSSTEENSGRSWFANLEAVECNVFWTEDPDASSWKGTLHRVETFDPQTRTLTVAVRIDPQAGGKRMPLVEGMFCQVDIPSKPLENAVRVPLKALTVDNTVYTCIDDRLKTTPVEVKRRDKTFAYVSEGLQDGDLIIATRLVNPLENMKCDTKLVELPELSAPADR